MALAKQVGELSCLLRRVVAFCFSARHVGTKEQCRRHDHGQHRHSLLMAGDLGELGREEARGGGETGGIHLGGSVAFNGLAVASLSMDWR